MEPIYKIQLEWLRAFLFLAKHQNYRKAAEELFISASALHAQIRNLENALGFELFEKNERKIYLTENGKRYYPLVMHALKSIEKDISELRNNKYDAKLNIGVSTYVSNYIMPGFVKHFFQRAPEIELEIKTCDAYMPQRIDEYSLDIGIDRKITNIDRLQYKAVCEGSIRLIVPDIPENAGLKREADYFKKYRILSNTHPTYWDTLTDKIKDIHPDADFMAIEDVCSVETLICAQQGVSYLPLYILKNRKTEGIKYIEPVDIKPPVSYTYMIWKKNNKHVEVFRNLFEAYIKEEQT